VSDTAPMHRDGKPKKPARRIELAAPVDTFDATAGVVVDGEVWLALDVGVVGVV
jgi:hypothetical protein